MVVSLQKMQNFSFNYFKMKYSSERKMIDLNILKYKGNVVSELPSLSEQYGNIIRHRVN